MANAIFIESSETLGLLYDRYHKIPDKVKEFLNTLESAVNEASKKDIPKIDLDSALEKFKKDVEMDIKTPDAVNIKEIKSMRKKIQDVKEASNKLLDQLGRIRHVSKYGDNAVKGVIIKPKVYKNTIDDEELASVNKWMRISGRCMDWAEKVVIDLMNLADQDLNILTLVNKVYFRRIFENTIELFNSDTIVDLLESTIGEDYYEPYLEGDTAEDEDDKEESNLLDDKIKNPNEEFFPVFSVVYSYDFDKWNEANADQRACIKRGKAITAFTKGDKYTHTLVSFDTSFEHMYHFIGDGFNPDSIYKNPATEVTKSIYVNVTFVTKDELAVIKNEIESHKEFKDKTGYSIKILIDQFLGKSNHIEKRQICSTFVAYLLACGNTKNLPRDYSLIRPEDITILPRSFYVMTFKDRADFKARQKEFDKKVKQIYDDNIEEIREYNNILPKVIIKEKYKKLGAIDKVVDWFANKIKKDKEESNDD